jgi:hypothetical protein
MAILRPASTLFDAMNECHVTGNHRTAIIVFSQSNFTDLYCERSRSYASGSNQPGWNYEREGKCRIGRCLDGTEDGVRLDWYDWKIDYWYWEDEAPRQIT